MPLSKIPALLALAALAVVSSSPLPRSSKVMADFGSQSDFFFGLATAPAQSEDHLDGAWVQFAEDGHVAAWKNYEKPAERLRFWSEPEIEIELARKAGVTVFRMGVDWGRLVTEKPSTQPGVQNATALARYKEIVTMVRNAGMRPMVTLFHHAMPKWAQADGGWENKDLPAWFAAFAGDVAKALDLGEEAFWNTFNEPTVFALLTYCSGIWPPGPPRSTLASLACIAPYSTYAKVMENIVDAHNLAFDAIRAAGSTAPIGVAHNIGAHVANSIIDQPSTAAIDSLMTFPFIDAVKSKIDFCGINYYGKEITKGGSVAILDDEEYSESGRCVYPDGLYELLTKFDNRYSDDDSTNFTYIITENGIADATDILRPSYIIEHLLAIKKAKDEGVPVMGYIHWTISDNWEWADGYCPHFGLVDVDRASANLTRTTRPSYDVYRTIAETGVVTTDQRATAWRAVQRAQNADQTRPFCRSVDGLTSLDSPVQRPFAKKDWRFSKAIDAANATFDPVVIIPGITSSVLRAKLDGAESYRDCATTSKDWFTLWLSSQQLGLRTKCFVKNMNLTVNSEGCVEDRPGLTVEPVGFGGTDGLSVLNVGDPYEYKLYYALFSAMNGLGYTAGKDLRSATYDWRKWGDKCFSDKYLADLKALVEETYVTANKVPAAAPRRVRLFCHSMGCSIALRFLDATVDAAWKDKYLSGLLALGPTWAGALSVPMDWISGPSYEYVPFALSSLAADASRSWPATLSLIPYQLDFKDPAAAPVWAPDAPVVVTKTRNYTVAQLPELVADAADYGLVTLGPKFLPAVEASRGMVAPGVQLSCVFITDVDTPGATIFPGDAKSPLGGKPKTLHVTEGDGTVNRQSMEVPCQHWAKEQGSNPAHSVTLHQLELGGTTHVGMLSDKTIIQLVLRVLSNQEY